MKCSPSFTDYDLLFLSDCFLPNFRGVGGNYFQARIRRVDHGSCFNVVAHIFLHFSATIY